MNLAENVAFGLRIGGMKPRARQAKADEMLAVVGLDGAGGKKPHALSGGQRQRVALARALAVEPEALLLDEPLGALDLKLRRAMQDELKAIQKRLGTTFVHVTHDQEEAMAIADKIIVMNAGQIEDVGPPERVYRDPATLFTAGFMGEVNLLDGIGDGTEITTPLGAVPHATTGPTTLAIRPEHLLAGGSVGLGMAKVEDTAFLGTFCRLTLGSAAGPLHAHVPPSGAPQVGDDVSLGIDPQHIKVFGP